MRNLFVQFETSNCQHVLKVEVCNSDLEEIHERLSAQPERRFWFDDGRYGYSLSKAWAIARAESLADVSPRIGKKQKVFIHF